MIESAGAASGKGAHVIKSHHNVGGLPDYMKRCNWSNRCANWSQDEVRRIWYGTRSSYEMVIRVVVPRPRAQAVRIMASKERVC